MSNVKCCTIIAVLKLCLFHDFSLGPDVGPRPDLLGDKVAHGDGNQVGGNRDLLLKLEHL